MLLKLLKKIFLKSIYVSQIDVRVLCCFFGNGCRRVVFGRQGFGAFWHLCRFAVEADQGAESAVVGVEEAVFGCQRTTEIIHRPSSSRKLNPYFSGENGMGSIEHLTEIAKALPETELARVIGYIEGLQARQTWTVSTTDDDWDLFEQYAGSWTGRFQREDCYDRASLR